MYCCMYWTVVLNVHWTGMLNVLDWCVVCTGPVVCTGLMCCILWARAGVLYGLVLCILLTGVL